MKQFITFVQYFFFFFQRKREKGMKQWLLFDVRYCPNPKDPYLINLSIHWFDVSTRRNLVNPRRCRDTLSKRDASHSVNKISFPFLILLEIRPEKILDR